LGLLELLARVLVVRGTVACGTQEQIHRFCNVLSPEKILSADLAFIAVSLPSVLTCIKDVVPAMLARISTIWPILNGRVHSLRRKCRPAHPMRSKIPRILYEV
jgi:hypothetical protein